MIYLLNKLPKIKTELIGYRAYDLHKLQSSNIEIVDTIICTTNLFRLFKKTGNIPEEYINNLKSYQRA